MTERYSWSEDDGMMLLTETRSGREMAMNPKNGEVSFKFLAWKDAWRKLYFTITGRDLTRYDSRVRSLEVKKGISYCEVGPGFGEFIPKIVNETGGTNTPLPTIIEPLDYHPLNMQMIYALEDKRLEHEQAIKDRMRTLLGRAKVLTDPNKVNLINLPLEEALERHPGLIGSMDVVVDQCGPFLYTAESLPPERRDRIDFDALRKRVFDLENSLLRPNGTLIVAGLTA